MDNVLAGFVMYKVHMHLCCTLTSTRLPLPVRCGHTARRLSNSQIKECSWRASPFTAPDGKLEHNVMLGRGGLTEPADVVALQWMSFLWPDLGFVSAGA